MRDAKMTYNLSQHHENHIIKKRRPGRPRKSLAQVISYGSRPLSGGGSSGGGTAYLADFQRKVEEKRSQLLQPWSADESLSAERKSDVGECGSDGDTASKLTNSMEGNGCKYQKSKKLLRISGDFGIQAKEEQSKSSAGSGGPSTPPQQLHHDPLDVRLSAEDQSPIIYTPSTIATVEKPARRKRTKMGGSGGAGRSPTDVSRKRPRTLKSALLSDTNVTKETAPSGDVESEEVAATMTPSGCVGSSKSIMMTLMTLADHYRKQMSAIYASSEE